MDGMPSYGVGQGRIRRGRGAIDFLERLLRRGAGPVARGVLFATAARLVDPRHPYGEAFEFEGQFGELADLDERDVAAARISGELEPTVGFMNDLIREQKFLDAQLLQIGLLGSRLPPKDEVEGVLGGIGEAGLEGGDAAWPVEPSGDPAEGGGGTSGLRGDQAMGTPSLQAEVGHEGHEMGRSFTGLTLPKARRHKIKDEG